VIIFRKTDLLKAMKIMILKALSLLSHHSFFLLELKLEIIGDQDSNAVISES
jgi:hypothetical protein